MKVSLASFQPSIAAAAIEVGRDADVVDADLLDDVVDVIDEVLDVRRGRRWELRVDRCELLVQSARRSALQLPPARRARLRLRCRPRPAASAAFCDVQPADSLAARGATSAAATASAERDACRQAELLFELGDRRRASADGDGYLHVARERDGLHHAAVLLQRQQLLVVQVAAVIRTGRARPSAKR